MMVGIDHDTLVYYFSLLVTQVQAWVEGVKDVIEPLIILLLAWALGAVIQVGGACIGHTPCTDGVLLLYRTFRQATSLPQ